MKRYSLVFLFCLIVLKLIYLGFESHYNGYLIDTITDPLISGKSAFEDLENYGHSLSAIGFTLLTLPFIYLFIKIFFNELKTFFILIPVSFFIFILFFKALTSLMDKIVEKNSDKRYLAYYTTIFKYGMLNNKLGYDSFISNKKLDNLDIADRVIISNMFLLTFTDKTLIDNLVKRNEDLVGSFISQYHFEDYKKVEKEFNLKVKEIDSLYKEYKSNNIKINKKFSSVDNGLIADAEYQQFKNDLELKYKHYLSESQKYKKEINPPYSVINSHYKDLKEYFRYQRYSKAQEKYTNKMYQNFGRYIEPKKWCSNNICPSRSRIKYMIVNEVKSNWKMRIGNIKPSLDKRSFFTNPIIRKKVALELRKKGLIVPLNFNYSRKDFIKAYKKKISREYNKVSSDFKKKFYKRFNKKVKLGLSYQQFSKYWKKELNQEYGQKFGDILYRLLSERNTTDFYKKFYIPYFKEKYLSDYVLNETQLNSPKHMEKGDNAIKNLFISPFAIFMSLLSAALNIVSLIVILTIVLLRNKIADVRLKRILNIQKLMLYIFIIYYPYSIGVNNNVLSSYTILEEARKSTFINTYYKVLHWIVVCEELNYNLVYKKYLR